MQNKPLALGSADNIGFDAAEFTPNVAIIVGDNRVDGSNDIDKVIGNNEVSQGVYLLNNNATIADFPGFSRTSGGAPFSQWGVTDTTGVTPRAGIEVALALANLGIEPGGTIKAAGILFCGASGTNRWIAKEVYGKSMTRGDSSGSSEKFLSGSVNVSQACIGRSLQYFETSSFFRPLRSTRCAP